MFYLSFIFSECKNTKNVFIKDLSLLNLIGRVGFQKKKLFKKI